MVLTRIVPLVAALILMATAAEARRVALVIGQNAYPEAVSATIGLPRLDNPVPDARSMAELLTKHGFKVISCDGKTPGCLDLDRARFLDALKRLEERAAGAELALVFYAGHGAATEEGNILAPVDARVDCITGAVTQGVLVERIMAATEPAHYKLLILDACRNNPLSDVCPNLQGKKLTFTRIEAGAMQGFLLVTSTQFGQTALDGVAGTHSPFATALFSAFQSNANIYFEQVFNEVARATNESTEQWGFLQIPGKVVGGEAPADCLAGKDCIGDARMAALAIDNERLTKDAAGVRNILEREELARGKAYTAEERQRRVAELEATLSRIGTSTDPLRQEARRLIDEGNVVDGQAKLDEALDADERALGEIALAAAERRKAAARNARDLAELARGADIIKALSYYHRATRLDPADPETWYEYAYAEFVAGHTGASKTAFEQAILKAQDTNPRIRYGATVGLGDVAGAQGDLTNARRLYDAAVAIAEPIAKADLGNAKWQRDLSVSYERIGDVLLGQGNLRAALQCYRTSYAIFERLAKADPGNAKWQHDLWVSYEKIGDVLRVQGNLPEALENYRTSHAIIERIGKANPGNAEWQHAVSVSHNSIGDVLLAQGNLPAALESYRTALAIRERLAKADPGNAKWQQDLSVSYAMVATVLQNLGDLRGALDSYRQALAVQESQAKAADPGHVEWQYNLSLSHNKIGDVLAGQGNLPAALESYRTSHAIIERLAKADPSDARWQHALSGSYDSIGSALAEQGNLPAALESYRTSHAIIERLAKADPGNAEWQHNLSVTFEKIGDVLRAQGNLPEALEGYRTSHAIIERLAKADPSDARWQHALSGSYDSIGDVLRVQGNLPAALESFRASLAISERLAKAEPENAKSQRRLGLAHGHVAMVLEQQGERQRALGAFRQGRDIIAKLMAATPTDATLPKVLAYFDGQIRALEELEEIDLLRRQRDRQR
jgi:tetratricopeptide (TPR) repeat protein